MYCAQRADDIMLGKITYEGMTFERDSETGSYADRVPKSRRHEVSTLAYRRIDRMDLDPLYLAIMRRDIFRSITHRLIGEKVASYRTMLFNKPAERGTHLPWHRDPALQRLPNDQYLDRPWTRPRSPTDVCSWPGAVTSRRKIAGLGMNGCRTIS